MHTTDYVAVVEVATRLEYAQPGASEALREYQPDIGRSARGWVQVTLRITATGLAHACTTAAAMARVATGAEALACQVMTVPEYDARRHAERGRHAAYAETGPLLPRQATGSARPWNNEPVERLTDRATVAGKRAARPPS